MTVEGSLPDKTPTTDTCFSRAPDITLLGRIVRLPDGTLEDRRVCVIPALTAGNPPADNGSLYSATSEAHNVRICRALDGKVVRRGGKIYCKGKFARGPLGAPNNAPNSYQYCVFSTTGLDNCKHAFDAARRCNPQGKPVNFPASGGEGSASSNNVCSTNPCEASTPRAVAGACHAEIRSSDAQPVQVTIHPIQASVNLPPPRKLFSFESTVDSVAGPAENSNFIFRQLEIGTGYTGAILTMTSLVAGANLQVREIGSDAEIGLASQSLPGGGRVVGLVSALAHPILAGTAPRQADGAQSLHDYTPSEDAEYVHRPGSEAVITLGVRVGGGSEVTVALEARPLALLPVRILGQSVAAVSEITGGTVMISLGGYGSATPEGPDSPGLLARLETDFPEGRGVWRDGGLSAGLRILSDGGILADATLEYDEAVREVGILETATKRGVRLTVEVLIQPADGETRLRAAIRAGDEALVREFAGAAGVKGPDENYPLHLALKTEPVNATIVNFLAEASPDVLRRPDGEGDFPLHLALRARPVNLEAVRRLLDQYAGAGAGAAHFGRRNADNMAPLHLAAALVRPTDAEYGQATVRLAAMGLPSDGTLSFNPGLVAAASILLDRGADVNETLSHPGQDRHLGVDNALGLAFRLGVYGPLHINTKCNDDDGWVNEDLLLMVKLLRDHGANPNLLHRPSLFLKRELARAKIGRFCMWRLSISTRGCFRWLIRIFAGRAGSGGHHDFERRERDAHLTDNATMGDTALDILDWHFDGSNCAPNLSGRAGKIRGLAEALDALGADCRRRMAGRFAGMGVLIRSGLRVRGLGRCSAWVAEIFAGAKFCDGDGFGGASALGRWREGMVFVLEKKNCCHRGIFLTRR